VAGEAQAIPEVVDAFTSATVTAFQELAGTEVALCEPAVASLSPPPADVNAVIELRRQTPGRLICAFPSAVLEALSRRYLPPGLALTPDILDDTAGEFANVIAGQAKTMLKGTPYHYALSTPIVTRNRCVPRPGSADGIELRFDCDAGPFLVWINVTAEGEN
jgi:CheY-specific phosphatase CheX